MNSFRSNRLRDYAIPMSTAGTEGLELAGVSARIRVVTFK